MAARTPVGLEAVGNEEDAYYSESRPFPVDPPFVLFWDKHEACPDDSQRNYSYPNRGKQQSQPIFGLSAQWHAPALKALYSALNPCASLV
jgi:hypothetical protein